MTVLPPPRPRRKRLAPWKSALIGAGITVLFAGGIFAVIYFAAPGGRKSLDRQFGDQHLKTAVALIELHRVRYGRYPDSLSELKYTGEWDQIALQRVRYTANADGTRYFVEVEVGWMGKPELQLPEEFWRGTGYDPNLKPKDGE